MTDEFIPRPKTSLSSWFYSELWHLATNKGRQVGLWRSCYLWSMTRTFRLILFLQTLFSGAKPVAKYCEDIDALDDKISQASETEVDDMVVIGQHKDFDKGILLRKSELLFQLEVTLTYLPVCPDEALAVLTRNDADLENLSKRVFYKAYYDASKSHGQLQLTLLHNCLDILHSCHKATRALLSRCETPVLWESDAITLGQMLSSLNSDENTIEKVKKGKHWNFIGFQGEDPCTDFRGVGELGLHHLYYFCLNHPLYARRMIQESGSQRIGAGLEDELWYPFALCGIHVTKFLCDLIQDGILQRNLLEAQLRGPEGLEQFTDALFSFLFVRCHLDWAEGVDKSEITSVFQFEGFFAEYAAFTLASLKQSRWLNDEFHPQLTKWW